MTFANLTYADPKKETFDLSFLDNKTIVKTGILTSQEEGRIGNFAIDYMDDNIIKRIIFGIGDERADMYILWQGIVGIDNKEDALKEKIEKAYDDLCWQKIKIVGNPLNKSYSFVGKNEKEILSLTIEELKMAGLAKYFKTVKSIEEKTEDIIYQIGLWAI